MRRRSVVVLGSLLLISGAVLGFWSQPSRGQTPPQRPPADPVQDAQTPRSVAATPRERTQREHAHPGPFPPAAAPPSSTALPSQPDGGRALGFDFSRDPFNAMKPMQTFEETMKADVDARPGVGAAQRKLLEGRYDLQPRLDPAARMSRGKPLVVGPTARLAGGLTWERLAAMN